MRSIAGVVRSVPVCLGFYQLELDVCFIQYVLIALEATLSMMLKVGLKPRFVKYAKFSLNASTNVSSFASLIGVARIAFVVQSYRTNRATCRRRS